MLILGLESSCDETAAAVVEEGRWLRANVVATQTDLHARYGGIVPEVASRQHLLSILLVLEGALEEARCGWEELDAIAVTRGPGLAGSLVVGVNLAKALAFARGLPLLGINHLEGHVYANWIVASPTVTAAPEPPPLPALCLVVSGGHTDLVLMREHGHFQRIGSTRDDAAGEAFDKAARLLGLGFPGGPAIERAARRGDPRAYPLPCATLRGSHDFSFSGLKTALLRLMERSALAAPRAGWPAEAAPLWVADLAASFQEAVVAVLVLKTLEAAQRHRVRSVLLSGGVAANTRLRQVMMERSPWPVFCPPPRLCTDNAAMIAACAAFRWRQGLRHDLSLDLQTNAQLLW